MVECDEAHLTELTDDGDPRRRRDQEAAELRDRLSGVRRTMEGLFGPERAAESLGLTGKLGFDPVTLHRQAERAVALLRGRTADTLPASRLAGVALDPAAWAAELSRPLGDLTLALAEVARERREAETTLAAKIDAITDYDAAFARVARLVAALFAAAELPLLAARVRPSGRRPGRTAENVAEEAPSEPASQRPAAPA
jgi:hypothetical protein